MQKCNDFTRTHFNAVSLLIYYLLTYHLNCWFLLNTLWIQNIGKLMQQAPAAHQCGMDHGITDNSVDWAAWATCSMSEGKWWTLSNYCCDSINTHLEISEWTLHFFVRCDINFRSCIFHNFQRIWIFNFEVHSRILTVWWELLYGLCWNFMQAFQWQKKYKIC